MIVKQMVSLDGDLDALIGNIDATLQSFDLEKGLRDEIYKDNTNRVFMDFYESRNSVVVAVYKHTKNRGRTVAKCHLTLLHFTPEKVDRICKLLKTSSHYIE